MLKDDQKGKRRHYGFHADGNREPEFMIFVEAPMISRLVDGNGSFSCIFLTNRASSNSNGKILYCSEAAKVIFFWIKLEKNMTECLEYYASYCIFNF